MNNDWIVLGDGFGFQDGDTYLTWIYWAPGTQTRQGLLQWGAETCGVVPWREGQPKHYRRHPSEYVGDLLEGGLLDILKRKVVPDVPSEEALRKNA